MSSPKDTLQEVAPTLFTLVGTAYLHILKHHGVLPKGVYIIVDAQSETDGIDFDEDADHVVIKIPLEARVAQDLVAKFGSKAQANALAAIPNISTQHGLAQVRAVGYAGVQSGIDAINFSGLFLNRVLPELRRMGGGNLKCVIHVHLSGAAGGMGSAGGIALVRAVQSFFMEPSDPEISTKVILLGALTFCAPHFQRTTENASASIAEWIWYVRHPLSDRVSTVPVLHELPPLETDAETREALALQYFIAMQADEFVVDENRNSPNMQVSGAVGGTNLNRTDHFTAIANSRLAAIVARADLPRVKGIMLEKPDVNSVKSVKFVPDHHRLKRESTASILQAAIDLPVNDLIAAIEAPSRVHHYQVRVRLKNGTVLRMDDVKLTFGTPLLTEKDASKRLRDMRTCHEVCFRELELLEQQWNSANEELEWAREEAFVAIRRLQSGWLGWLMSGFKAFDNRMSRVEDAMKQLRQVSDAVLQLQSKIVATESALDDLAHEVDLLLAKLVLLVKRLKSCLPQGDERRDRRLVEPLPLSARFPELLRYVEAKPATKPRLVEILSASVATVTIDGLADIAQCEPTIDAVVGSVLARKNVRYRCPAWGGEAPLSPSIEKIVFPPVTAGLRAKIEAHAGNESRHIAFARAACGPPNIVCIETVYAKDVADVITPFYDAGVRRALASDLAPLFVVNSSAFTERGYQLPAEIVHDTSARQIALSKSKGS